MEPIWVVGTKWSPCWPHEACDQGCCQVLGFSLKINVIIYMSLQGFFSMASVCALGTHARVYVLCLNYDIAIKDKKVQLVFIFGISDTLQRLVSRRFPRKIILLITQCVSASLYLFQPGYYIVRMAYIINTHSTISYAGDVKCWHVFI